MFSKEIQNCEGSKTTPSCNKATNEKTGILLKIISSNKEIFPQTSEPEDNRKVYDEKAAKNCPSYLIWSIFTRKRELQKVQSLEKKQNNSEGMTTI